MMRWEMAWLAICASTSFSGDDGCSSFPRIVAAGRPSGLASAVATWPFSAVLISRGSATI